LNLGGAIAIPVKHSTLQIMWKSIERFLWMTDDSRNWMAFPELLVEH
jgi:hypothetical protein